MTGKVKKKLTAKEDKFADEFLIDLNGTQAAIRAGYSKKTAANIASQNLGKLHIQEAIAERRDKLAKDAGITPERVLAEYAKIGFSDLRKVLTSEGTLIDPQYWDDETAGAISGLEVVARHTDEGKPVEYVHKFKLWDKKGALDSMAKYFEMFDGKKGADDSDADAGVSQDIRSAARDVAFLMRRAVESVEGK